jgi:hypothetical protein
MCAWNSTAQPGRSGQAPLVPASTGRWLARTARGIPSGHLTDNPLHSSEMAALSGSSSARGLFDSLRMPHPTLVEPRGVRRTLFSSGDWWSLIFFACRLRAANQSTCRSPSPTARRGERSNQEVFANITSAHYPWARRHSTRVSLSVKGLGNGPLWLRCWVSHIVSPSSRYE